MVDTVLKKHHPECPLPAVGCDYQSDDSSIHSTYAVAVSSTIHSRGRPLLSSLHRMKLGYCLFSHNTLQVTTYMYICTCIFYPKSKIVFCYLEGCEILVVANSDAGCCLLYTHITYIIIVNSDIVTCTAVPFDGSIMQTAMTLSLPCTLLH